MAKPKNSKSIDLANSSPWRARLISLIAVLAVVGALLLTVLFVGSMRFTEAITLSKYPEYADYQAITSPMIPWLPRRVSEAESTAA